MRRFEASCPNVAPGGSAVYTLYAEREGNHLLYSTAATTGGEGDGGQIAMGLFGSINVEPKGSEWYRSQLTEADLTLARKKNSDGTLAKSLGGHPIINYDAVYPSSTDANARQSLTPVVEILDANLNIVHSDLNAIITGLNRGNFPSGAYQPIATAGDVPGATSSTTVRNKPFREFTIIYHDELKAVQAFPQFNEERADGADNPLAHTLHSVRDAFGINYGTGGIGSEILANRLGVGPMKDCTECLYEEFFLSAWTVGDPAQLVDRPASTQVDSNGNKIPNSLPATKVLFPDDPSNVYHSYLNDPVKMRVVHAGPKEHHIHHLHAHQWLNSPNSDNSAYLDSKAFGPGYSFTTEITYGGSGNRNKTPGDSIFHCHFYPHFAMGMWSLWRVHDVLETGTKVDTAGRPTSTSRGLPDGEIAAGTPIPAVVPIPTLVMPPMPTDAFQGFPFYIPGVAGHRPPHPPMDTINDGGLPRHVITGGTVTHHKEHDPVQIRILVGAHEEGHNFGVHGIKWKFEPSEPNSGFRNNQMMGISEHYEFIVPKLPRQYDDKAADYLYAPGLSVNDQWNGLWGLMRVYAQRKYDLVDLPNNLKKNTLGYTNQGDFNGVCPKTATLRPLNVTAVAARTALPQRTLVYNNRDSFGGKLHDPWRHLGSLPRLRAGHHLPGAAAAQRLPALPAGAELH